MSRLQELLDELCPNGVEYERLVDVADVLYGYPCDASKFNNDRIGMPLVRIRNVLEGETDTYTSEEVPEEYFINTNDLLIGMDGNFHVGNWKGEQAVLCQRVCKIYAKEDEKRILNGFLSHLLGPIIKNIENSKQSGTVKHLLAKDINAISVPVPPLEVQCEIVRVLDSFTLLTDELTDELTARKKQYEYYRDTMISFDDSVPRMKLGDIARDIYRGAGIKRDEVTEEGIPCVRYGEIYTSYDISFTECKSNTTIDVVSSPKYFEHGDVIFTITGESVEDIAKSIVYLGHEKCLAGGDTVVLKHDLEPRYLSYALSTTDARRQKSAGKVKSKVVHSSVPALKEIVVPVPTMEVQKKIADILDSFHELINNISEGIPAEIEARHKQYEYYRDKLLSFKELEA